MRQICYHKTSTSGIAVAERCCKYRLFSAAAYTPTPLLSGREAQSCSTKMKPSLPVSSDVVIAIAQAIGHCDFRTTVSLYTNRSNSPWVITVGESDWQRHLTVLSTTVGIYGSDAELAILESSQSDNSGYDIRTYCVERVIRLSELIAGNYISVKKALYPPALATKA